MKIKEPDVTNEGTLKQFLIQSAEKHKRLYHYTTFEGLLSIIKYKSFLLTRLDKLNDKAEVSITGKRFSKKYFVMSYTGERESVAMWKMYGKPSGVKLRLDFDMRLFMETVGNLYYQTEEERIEDELLSEEQFKNKEPNEKLKRKPRREKHYLDNYKMMNCFKNVPPLQPFADKIMLADVVYIDERTGRARHNENQLDNLTENVRNYVNINGFLKYSTWEYERETRLRVAPSFINKGIEEDAEKDRKEEIDHIYIEFGEPLINDFHITYNPCMSDELKNAVAESLNRMAGCNLSYTDSDIDNEIEDL